MNSIDLAYFLHTWRWLFRILFTDRRRSVNYETDTLKQKIVELFKNDYDLQFVFSKVDKKFLFKSLLMVTLTNTHIPQ